MKLVKNIKDLVIVGSLLAGTTLTLSNYNKTYPEDSIVTEAQTEAQTLETKVNEDINKIKEEFKEYLLKINEGESTFDALNKILPIDQAYFASMYLGNLTPGEHLINFDIKNIEPFMINAGLNLEARAKQKEYVLDFKISKDRANEDIVDAIRRITNLSEKELYLTLQEFKTDKNGLDLQPGIHYLYLGVENVKQQLRNHYSEVFGFDVDSEDFKFPDKSEAKKVIKGYTTYYYTPKESDFDSYKAFKKSVKIQGSGVLNDGRILRYNGKVLDPSKGQVGVNGITAAGTNPIPLGTLAASKNIKLGSIVYVEFDENNPLNGYYKVDDRGSAINGNHFDLYVGVGKDSLNDAYRFVKGNKNATFYVF